MRRAGSRCAGGNTQAAGASSRPRLSEREAFTQPSQLGQSRKLIRRLRQLDRADISRLMNVSDNLAELNRQRYKQWKTPFKPENARQAMFAFKGDVYLGLDAYSLDEDAIDFAQQHLRILSGLYGILRPLDLMQPYRLEMGTRLDTEAGANLYQFWNERITRLLNRELRQSGTNTLVNLASNEYFKAVKPKLLKAGIARDASTAVIATTIISSTRVKPPRLA